MPHFFTTHDRERQEGAIQVNGQLGARSRPQGKVLVTGKDHQANLLPFGDDLVIRLEVEPQSIERAGLKWFTFGQGLMVLRVRPATRDDVVCDFRVLACVPGK